MEGIEPSVINHLPYISEFPIFQRTFTFLTRGELECIVRFSSQNQCYLICYILSTFIIPIQFE